MNSNNKQLIQTLGQRLGLSSQSTLCKAEELQRRLSMRGVKGLTTSAEVVICLQLAAALTGESCDKSLCAKLSGLTAVKHRGQFQALGQLLGVDQRITIHDLAITHSALAAEKLAQEALKQYTKEAYDIDASLAVYQTAALLAACKIMKIKLDKKRIYESSGAQRKVFDKLLEKLEELSKKINEKNNISTAGEGKMKGTRTLMDIIEDNLAKEDVADKKKQQQREESTAKQARIDENQEDQEYEDWKRKILLEAEQG